MGWLFLLNVNLDTLGTEWQLEELDRQLEELKQQATPKFRLAIQFNYHFSWFCNPCGIAGKLVLLLRSQNFLDLETLL